MKSIAFYRPPLMACHRRVSNSTAAYVPMKGHGLQWNSKQRCHCTNHSDEHPASSTGFRILCGDAKDMSVDLLLL